MRGIAGADVEHGIGAEGYTATIMKGTGRDSDDDISIKVRIITLVLQMDDCVGASSPLLPCEHNVDVGALRKLRMQGKAHETSLAFGSDFQRGIEPLRKLPIRFYQADLPAPLADEGASVGKKDERPGNLETRDPALDRDTRRLSDKLILHGLRHSALKGRGVNSGFLKEKDGHCTACQSTNPVHFSFSAR